MSYPYIIQGDNLVIVIGSKSHTISKTHPTYLQVVQAIKDGNWDLVPEIIEPKKVIRSYSHGNVSIKGETLFWKGKEMNTGLAVRMINMLQEGFPIEPMVRFMENLMTNPSKRAVDELYTFLEKATLPITPDGHFLAYKKVRANYMDVHSGTFDNSVGQVVTMDRNQVDDNRDKTCSAGLHFCSESYLKSFGGERVMILKINPADVVSIPKDYNDAKGRCCRYEVIGEVDPESTGKAFPDAVQTNSSNNNGQLPPQKAWPFPRKDNPVKYGDSPFYHGYADGYADKSYWNLGSDLEDTNAYSEGYSKGEYDRACGKPARYSVTAPVKTGSSLFYRGYSDGRDDRFDSLYGYNVEYMEGHYKGRTDLQADKPARYKYVSQPALKPDEAWPHPRNS